ncbi:outer membrane lipoprotein carrier protein LolA [Shewanella sp. 0m-4]
MKYLLRLVCTLFLLLLSSLVSSTSYAEPDNSQSSYTELFQFPANKADLLSLSKQLSPSEHAKGKFTQYRYLKVLKKPLVSQGEFVFSKSLGVIWQQNSPFASTLILKDKQLIQIDSQGNISVNNAQQAGGGMSDIMPTLLNALLSGDINALEQHFELSLKRATTATDTSHELNPQWQLGLKPLDPLLAKAMPKMLLAGKQQIQTLVLYSANGDRSQIEFSSLDESPLSQQDKSRFEPESKSAQP